MITYVAGDLFSSPAQVLVNTVNTVGVMGKGVALEFKRVYPEMFNEYQILCESGDIDIGVLWIYRSPHKWILNFPTKRDWRNPSRPEYIEAGLNKLKENFSDLGIHSIAFPALGCGNGELDWEGTVRPLMEEYLVNLPADVFVHPPLTLDLTPEHRNQRQIRDWLRSEPATLPFSEVWDDLVRLLRTKNEFTTFGSESSFVVTIGGDQPLLDGNSIETGRRLIISTKSRKYNLRYNDLRELWLHFRQHGYLRRGTVLSFLENELYYLMPVLEELPYVKRILLSISGQFKSPHNSRPKYNALQYSPPTRSEQPTLFSL